MPAMPVATVRRMSCSTHGADGFIRASMRFLTFENPSPTGASPIGTEKFG
jgi:hypothetical protein